MRNSRATVLERFSAALETACFRYEALIATEARQCLVIFLGARPFALITDTIRQRKRLLSETIQNFAEVRRALTGTRTAAFMAD